MITGAIAPAARKRGEKTAARSLPNLSIGFDDFRQTGVRSRSNRVSDLVSRIWLNSGSSSKRTIDCSCLGR